MHNSHKQTDVLERIHSSTGSAGLAVESINRTEWPDILHTSKGPGFKQEIALLKESLSEIKLPSDIHPATEKSDEDIRLQVKAMKFHLHYFHIPIKMF